MKVNRNKCIYCGSRLISVDEYLRYGASYGAIRTREHIVPKSKRGRDDPANIVFACAPCNEKRGNQDLEIFIETIKDEAAILRVRELIEYANRNFNHLSFNRKARHIS